MFKIAAMLYTIVAPVFMGVFFAVTLFVEQLYNGQAMIAAALIGAAVAAPVSLQIAKAVAGGDRAV